MTKVVTEDPVAALEEIRLQLTGFAERLSAVERLVAKAQPAVVAASVTPQGPRSASEPAHSAGISEDEVLALSAAVAAFLGLHAHIRQIRLIRSGNWALQGRATIQGSHILKH